MNAAEAAKLSIDRKPVWEKECFEKKLKQVYDAIEITASMGGEYTVAINRLDAIQRGYIEWGLLPQPIVDKLRADGFYVRNQSIYTGTSSMDSVDVVIAWGKKKIEFEEKDKKAEEYQSASQEKCSAEEPKKKKWWQFL